MHLSCKVGKKAGSEVPRWMTGSAGTAMDVLVACFSKTGGGSGRRGCKGSAQAVISVDITERCVNLFVSCFSFSVFSGLYRVKKLQKHGRHGHMSYGDLC